MSTASPGAGPAGAAQDSPGTTKVKTKAGVTTVVDKSKPVRTALEKNYAQMAQAYYDDDPRPVAALRAPEFCAQSPDGRRSTPQEAADYLRASFDQVERTLQLSFHIDTLEVHADTAIASIHQRWRRMQQKGGKLRLVETEARQREWWRNTPDGWRIFFINAIHPGVWKVDGKRVDPSKPYDPEAPPYDPDD